MPIDLYGDTMQGLANALAVHQRRHQIIASNLANVETPGYRAHDMEFKRALEAAFAPDNTHGRTNSAAVASEAAVIDDREAPARADGNTVDVDLQMTKLAANSGRYNALAKIMAKKFTLLRQSIDGVR